MIRTSKKGIIFTSPISEKKYLVHKWKDLGNGKIIALEKEEIKEEADKVIPEREDLTRFNK